MISIRNSLRLSNLVSSCRTILNTCRQNYPVYNQNVGIKTLEERLGLPPKPKKPLTPYFRFMKEIRSTITQENPKASLPEVVRIIATKWETVDEATKKKLQDEYKKDQISYIERRAKYDSTITSDQRNDLKQLKQEVAEAKERKATKKKIKELGRPKKPPSAFLKFISKERAVTPQGNLTYRQWHAKVTEKWSRMSDADKQIYIDEVRKDMEKYKQEISKWEEKMVRLGHIDVVRSDTLIDPPTPKSRKKTVKKE